MFKSHLQKIPDKWFAVWPHCKVFTVKHCNSLIHWEWLTYRIRPRPTLLRQKRIIGWRPPWLLVRYDNLTSVLGRTVWATFSIAHKLSQLQDGGFDSEWINFEKIRSDSLGSSSSPRWCLIGLTVTNTLPKVLLGWESVNKLAKLYNLSSEEGLK